MTWGKIREVGATKPRDGSVQNGCIASLHWNAAGRDNRMGPSVCPLDLAMILEEW